jgi:hypothetical protein
MRNAERLMQAFGVSHFIFTINSYLRLFNWKIVILRRFYIDIIYILFHITILMKVFDQTIKMF